MARLNCKEMDVSEWHQLLFIRQPTVNFYKTKSMLLLVIYQSNELVLN